MGELAMELQEQQRIAVRADQHVQVRRHTGQRPTRVGEAAPAFHGCLGHNRPDSGLTQGSKGIPPCQMDCGQG